MRILSIVQHDKQSTSDSAHFIRRNILCLFTILRVIQWNHLHALSQSVSPFQGVNLYLFFLTCHLHCLIAHLDEFLRTRSASVMLHHGWEFSQTHDLPKWFPHPNAATEHQIHSLEGDQSGEWFWSCCGSTGLSSYRDRSSQWEWEQLRCHTPWACWVRYFQLKYTYCWLFDLIVIDIVFCFTSYKSCLYVIEG
jgi:hypothetical protein